MIFTNPGKIRKDRFRLGVMLAFKSRYSMEEIKLENIDAGTAWACINTGVIRWSLEYFIDRPAITLVPWNNLRMPSPTS